MSKLTSPTQPPDLSDIVFYWERSPYPFDLSQTDGWAGIDYAENVVTWVKDGSSCTGNDAYTITEGYFADNRMFAYPPGSDKLQQRHQDQKRRLNEQSNE